MLARFWAPLRPTCRSMISPRNIPGYCFAILRHRRDFALHPQVSPGVAQTWSVEHGGPAAAEVMGVPTEEPHTRSYPDGPPPQTWLLGLPRSATVELVDPSAPWCGIALVVVVDYVGAGYQAPVPIAVRVCVLEVYATAPPYAHDILQAGALVDVVLGRHLVRPVLPKSPSARPP